MSQKAAKSKKRTKPKSTLRSTLSLSALAPTFPPPAKKQKTKALTSIARPPVFDLTGTQTVPEQASAVSKGKGKARADEKAVAVAAQDTDDRLWVDRYEPITEDDLAVNKRKVQDVRQWLLEALTGGPSGKLKKYRRILALTGPAGTGKTATLRVLSRELGFELVEWQNGMDQRFDSDGRWDEEYEGLADKFRNFLARASSCRSVLAMSSSPAAASLQSQSKASTQGRNQSSQSNLRATQSYPQLPASSSSGPTKPVVQSKQQVILLEDLPNILHLGTQAAFHAALEAFAALPDGAPLVLIISDAGLRGEDAEADTGAGWRRAKEAVDVRSVLPPSLLNSPYVTQIGFRPIAPTYLRPALQTLLNKRFPGGGGPSKDILGLVVDSANGDIRSAVMALQFATPTTAAKGKKRGGNADARALMEVVTRREQSLALFHLLGKLFYNKRKGDPPGTSASAKELQRDRELDARLRKEPPLPAHLQEHARRPSRVDVEVLYADSPIDASLLSLYLHQNYTQYCGDLAECAALADTLSWIDANGAESWHEAHPHRFHTLALGTLHALPSPVQRRGQKPYKPVFFENLRREREAEDGLRDVQEWLMRDVEASGGVWSRRDIALGLGGVLKARDLGGVSLAAAPGTHRLFSKLEFTRASGGLVQLSEEGDEAPESELEVDEPMIPGGRAVKGDEEPRTRGWLSDDDIEEFSD